ncbi:MAG: aminopeptidase P family protein [Planctomycetes bacterium]|nr:aminopeptidase P family protein [Planctomycetota bacterium]
MSRQRLVDASRQRLLSLQRVLREAGLAGYLADSPVEVAYLSQFGGDDSWLLVPARGKATLITDFRYGEDARTDCPHLRIRLRTDSLAKELARLTRRLDAPVGFNPETVTVSLRRSLVRLVGAGGLRPLAGAVTRMRIRKDPTEVQAVERALRVAEAAYGDFLGRIRLGMTEIELAGELEYAMRRRGAAGPAFETICAVGPNASRPHARPGNRRLTAETPLLIDFGALLDGYRCDLTRMVLAARIRPDVRRAYEAVLAAQEAAILAAGPGVPAANVDQAARQVLIDRGYRKTFGHGTGHGLGREVHEGPSLSPRSAAQVVLEPGMIVTIEPGLYVPRQFGIRIEDDVLITGKGRRVLSRLPKKLEQVVLSPRR